jgi:hypothetical protein
LSSKRIEAAIQRALVVWLRAEHPALRFHATLNENSHHQTDMGCDIGIPDLLLFRRVGEVLHVLFLELKKKTGKLSPSQKDWATCYHLGLAGSNTDYAVAYGFEQAKEMITEWANDTKTT